MIISKKQHLALSFMIILSLFMAAIPTKVSAEEVWPAGIDITSASAVVMEVDSHAVLYEKDMDHEYYPASITKIVTAIVALENSDLDETVNFSEDAVFLNEGDASNIAREPGEEMSMENCLYGMMLESANECAWAIAEHVGDGKMQNFYDLMNEKAKSVGCEHTNFANPNGLPLENHYTSAHDMALIASDAIKNDEFKTIIGTKSYAIPPTNKHSENTYLNNTHCMISNHKTDEFLYDGCLGGKTGYTDEAGHTLVTFAERDGITLVCVIMNSNETDRYVDTINLFDYCFGNFVTYPVAETEALSSAAKTGAGKFGEAAELFSVEEDATVILPKTASVMDATAEVAPSKEKSGNVIGTLSFTYADKYIGGGKLMVAKAGDYEYPFRNIDDKKGGSSNDSIEINYKTLGYGLLAIALLASIITLLVKISPYVYRIRANNKIARMEKKNRLPVIKRNNRKRRRR